MLLLAMPAKSPLPPPTGPLAVGTDVVGLCCTSGVSALTSATAGPSEVSILDGGLILEDGARARPAPTASTLPPGSAAVPVVVVVVAAPGSPPHDPSL